MFLIYKPDKIIDWLKLDKGFDDDRIDFQNFNNTNILKLAVIVIGGIMLIKNIPAFLSIRCLPLNQPLVMILITA